MAVYQKLAINAITWKILKARGIQSLLVPYQSKKTKPNTMSFKITPDVLTKKKLAAELGAFSDYC